ncbi:MAG: hypothetical protein E6344_18700 [Clostridium sp.]|nr:hypothetical protein [Clostridium sp.]MDU7085727.1 hypothetical protein [Clostridium sp.]
MANQYTKIPLYIEEAEIEDEAFLIKNLSLAVVDSLEDILPKDIETMDLIIKKVKDEL